uniref:Fork-head domain-containing protein n=1 Tax=Panagrellus redivivus TaxID=6233 RepID=A0A7E4W2C2_PANRE
MRIEWGAMYAMAAKQTQILNSNYLCLPENKPREGGSLPRGIISRVPSSSRHCIWEVLRTPPASHRLSFTLFLNKVVRKHDRLCGKMGWKMTDKMAAMQLGPNWTYLHLFICSLYGCFREQYELHERTNYDL